MVNQLQRTVKIALTSLLFTVAPFLLEGCLMPIRAAGSSQPAAVTLPAEPSFDSIEFCPGTLAAPRKPCATSHLAWQSGEEELWVRWQFEGLRAGDEVELHLDVGGESRVAARWIWESGPSGQQLHRLELLDKEREGSLRLLLLVNGSPIAYSQIDLR